MAGWRRRRKRLLATMARQSLAEACDVYDAMVASMGPEVILTEETIGLAVGDMDSEAVDTTGDGAIIRDDAEATPPTTIDSVPTSVDRFIADGALAVGGAFGISTDGAHGATAGGEPIADDGITINRKRPFYGPDINSDRAFKSGFIDSTLEKKSLSPKRKGGKAEKNKAASKPTATGPLPIVKPADYEDFLQAYFNAHPTFGYRKLLKALEDSYTSRVVKKLWRLGAVTTSLSQWSRIYLTMRTFYGSNLKRNRTSAIRQ